MVHDPRYERRLAETPSRFLKYIDRYNFESEMLQSLVQQNPDVIYSETFSLATAQTYGNPKFVNVAGRAVVIYGINTQSSAAYDPVANTGVETIAAGAFVFCRFNQPDPNPLKGMPLKHNRGYRGDFNGLYLSWPAQANTSARLLVLKFDEQPWQSGEAAT